MAKLNIQCTKCGGVSDVEVGKVDFSAVPEGHPRFEKEIVCQQCGVLRIDEIELTEEGQGQLTALWMSQ